VTARSSLMAAPAATHVGLTPTFRHLDTPGCHVDGRENSAAAPDEQVGHSTQGSRREPRPDLTPVLWHCSWSLKPVSRCCCPGVVLVQNQKTFLAMLRCPLSLWERVRVRLPQGWRTDHTPSPPALSRGERELGHAQQGLLDMH
jgi:hypothetical protein